MVFTSQAYWKLTGHNISKVLASFQPIASLSSTSFPPALIAEELRIGPNSVSPQPETPLHQR